MSVCVCAISLYVYMYIYVCAYTSTCVSLHVCLCVCVCLYVCIICIHTQTNAHTHTHTHAAEMNYSPPRDKNEFSSQSSLSAAATREALTSGGEDRGRCGAKFRGDAHQIYIHAYIYLHIYVGRMAWLELSTALGV